MNFYRSFHYKIGFGRKNFSKTILSLIFLLNTILIDSASSTETVLPYEELAINIAQGVGRPAKSISRFSTGHQNFVFDVEEINGNKYVINIPPLGYHNQLKASLYWYSKFEPLNIAIPKIISYNISTESAYLILERLPGTDLGNIYNTLNFSQKKKIVKGLVNIQDKVSTLPKATGYGYATSYEDTKLLPTWKNFIQKIISEDEEKIKKSNIFETKYIKKLNDKLNIFDNYFSTILSKPFLNDTTTKNVIIEEGKLTGIVDIEEICFGDRLLVLALTRMALLSKNMSTDYVDIWIKKWQLNEEQKKALSFYTLLFCVNFMGEIGQTFKNQVSGNIYDKNISLYKEIFNKIYEEI